MDTAHNRRQGDKELQEHQLKEEKRLLEIEQNIKSLEEKIDTLSKDVTDLVSAWKAASWLVSLVKWVGGIAVAVTAIVTLLKGVK
jgi:uncharacterized protein Yka (UPF0111/DUF47 family)